MEVDGNSPNKNDRKNPERNYTVDWHLLEYKDIYGKLDAVSRLMMLKKTPLPEKIRKLEA